ncbi:complement receptor type 2-like [Clavelina lepadiformis]|uniref:complement receptor type 2-like n=1 Tax=Clavelina lepadiformis TaxID=159417 RepID=UPI0040437C72
MSSNWRTYLFLLIWVSSLTKAQEPENDPHISIAPIPNDPCLQDPDQLVPFPIINDFFENAPIERVSNNLPSPGCFPPQPGPNSVASFDVDSRFNPSKTTVKYLCDPGFSSTGPTQFSCQYGMWNVELRIPNCTIPETGCGNPPFLPGGDIVGDPPYYLDEKISYRCSEGFELGNLNASSISRCEPGNQWSLQKHDENFPTCLPTCHAPLSPPDGAVLLSADEILNKETFSLGTEVTYGCKDPCSTHVKDTFTCTPRGWSGTFSSCPLNCNNPPSVANASIFPTSTREESQARYFCDPGYYTSDVTLIQCIHGEWISLEEQSWSLVSQFKLILPNCTEPTDGCGSPPLLINGAFERSIYRTFNWRTQSQLIQKYDTYNKITYFCIDGYYLNAPAGSVSTCLAGNRWSLNKSASNFPMCEPDCGNPSKATNATMRVFSTTEGSVAHYICDEGLSTNDVTTSTCRRNGNVVLWDLVQLPRCTIPMHGCGNPPLINNGFVVRPPPYNEGDAVTYDCFPGYELIATDGFYLLCRQDLWINMRESRNFPFCRRVCLALPTLPSGGVLLVDETRRNKDGVSFSNGVEQEFSCQPGYRLVRDATLTCVEGNWNWTVIGKPAKAPLCYRDCGPPPEVANATVNALATVETWIENYVCNPGFSTVDTRRIECDSSGKWVVWYQETNTLPTCTMSSSGCGNPPFLKNGSSYFVDPDNENTVRYFCDYGFGIHAPNGTTSTCISKNRWSLIPGSANFPTCNADCVQPPPEPIGGLEIVNKDTTDNDIGFGFQSMVTYGCKEGSTLIGSTTLSCSNGMWLPDLPTCVQYCSAPPTVPNSKFRRTSNSRAQSYEYACDPGFFTTDFTVNICLDDGTWSLTKLPQCTVPRTGCGNPSPLQNGKYSGEAPFPEGATVTYQCKDGFRMVAPSGAVSTCQPGNTWSLEINQKNFPACQLGCKTKPPRPDNGVLILNEPVPDINGLYAIGSAIAFGCDYDEYVIGPSFSKCFGIEWFPNVDHIDCIIAPSQVIPQDTFQFYGPRRALDVAKTNDFIQSNFFISTNMTNYTAASRTNGSDLIPITSVCGYPGFCVGSPPDIYFKCFSQTLFECEMCGVGRAAVFLFFVLLFGLAIFFCNVLVIWVGYKRFNRGKGNKMDICKTSLAVADCLTGIQILVVVSYNFSWTMNSNPEELNQQHSTLRGSPQAYVGGILFVFTVTSSLFHLVYMGGERLYAIAKPIRYKWQKKTSVYVGLGVVWILSLLSATVPAWFPNQLVFTCLVPTLLFYPAIKDTASNVDYSAPIVVMIIFYILPFLLLTVSCLAMSILIFTSSSNKRRNKRKLAVLKTITIMQISFTVTLIPLAVAGSLLYSNHLDCYNFAQPYMVCFYLYMTNSLVNFIVYSARDQDFRNEIVDIFRPGYLKQLSFSSNAQTPRKSENSSKKVDSSENVIEAGNTQQSNQTSL